MPTGAKPPANGNDNRFQRFSARGMDFLILHLQAGPGTDVIAWADAVLKAHPDHKAILTTHGFLGLDGERNVDVLGSTQYIWDGLAVPSGADAQWVWDRLQPNMAYEGYARATDVTGRTTFSPVWRFTTGTGDVLPPVLSDTLASGLTEIEVFSDSFEVGEWSGLWTEDSQNDWYRSAQRATQGARSAEVDGSAANASLTSIAIDLQGRNRARISFDWLIESGLDTGEYLDFRVSTNGGSTWTGMAILRGDVETENVWHPFTLNLTGISQLRLQFRGRMSGSSEDVNVDNVKVVAY